MLRRGHNGGGWQVALEEALGGRAVHWPPARTPPNEIGNNEADEVGNTPTRSPEIRLFNRSAHSAGPG